MESLIRSVKLAKEPRRLAGAGSREINDAVSEVALPDMINDVQASQPEAANNNAAVCVNEEIAEYARRESDLRGQLHEAVARVTEFEQDIEVRRREAIEQGRAEGYRAGVEEAQALLGERIADWDRLLGGVRQAAGETIGGLEEASVAIVFEALLKMIGRAATDKEAIKGMVRQVLAQAKDSRAVIIKVAPRDYALIKDSKGDLIDSDSTSIEVVADDRIEFGGCLIETETGSLDGRLQIQIQRMYETLMRAYQAGDAAA